MRPRVSVDVGSHIFFELSLRCYETNVRRTWHIALGPTDIPHTRRPRARPTPARCSLFLLGRTS